MKHDGCADDYPNIRCINGVPQMTAWQRTTNRTPARYTRTALQHARVQFPRLSIAGGLLSVAFATVLVVMAAAFTTPVVALGALGLLAVAAGVALRPPHAAHAAPAAPPMSGLVRTGSISSDVLLDYDRGTAEKVYRPTRPVRLLYRLSFQAKFPYTDNVDAFEAARLRREVAGLLTQMWFGENMVSPALEVRPTDDGRFMFVTELVRGTAPRDAERARAFLNELAERFEESGLPLWQVAPYNPRAAGNLIERADGAYRIIDLESNLVTPFLRPRSLFRAIAAGLYPSFDEIDTVRLGRYLEMNSDMLTKTLGSESAARLFTAAGEYAEAQSRWHASEPRIATKMMRFAYRLVNVPGWFRAMKRLTAGGERMAANVANAGIDTWVAEGVLTESEGADARAQLATPEMTAATAHLGAHLAITVPLRFPLGSIARTGWTLALRARGEWDGLRGKGSASTARRVHSLPVAALAAIPGLGSFAYLAAKPFRQEPVIRAVAFDQALRHSPARSYERLHLGALTRSMAKPEPVAHKPLASRVVRAFPVVLAGLAVAAAATVGLKEAGVSQGVLEAGAGMALAAAGVASLFAFRRFWSAGESHSPAEQAGSFFWLLAGAGLVGLGLDTAFRIHQVAADAIDNLGLPMVPGAEEAHVLMLAGYALSAALVAWAFRGEVTADRASAALIVTGGALAAGALAYEAVTGDAAMPLLAASGLVMLTAAGTRAWESRPVVSFDRASLPGKRLPRTVERTLARVEPSLRQLARSRNLALTMLAVSSVVVAVSVAAGRALFGSGEEHQLFRDFGPVTFFMSGLMLLGGAFGLLAWQRDRGATGRPFYADLWAVWGLGFILLAIEAPLDVHGRVGGLISWATPIDHPFGFNRTSDAIVAFYGLAGIGLTALLAKQLFEYPMAIVRFGAAVPAAAVVIAIDGFLGHSAFMWVLEESVELVAASFFVAGFAERYRAARRRAGDFSTVREYTIERSHAAQAA